MLLYGNRFYLIGEGHKEFLADKTRDNDYYVLALAAIAREMNIKKLTSGRIRIAAGLPLTWVSGQRDDFKTSCRTSQLSSRCAIPITLLRW